MENPFYITGIIHEPFFCDRENETEWFVKTLENKAHILLTSPRRMGKTQLIRHAFEQPVIRDKYYTFYTDIFSTNTLEEMVLLLSKEIYSVLVPKGTAVLNRFLSIIRSLSGCFSYNPVSGQPTFEVRLGDIQSPALTLEEIFSYLETADKPCIFAIDEFQQIASYPQKNVEALMRTHIQRMNNCCFIFAGSNRHLLENMFNSSAKPFYNSAEQLYLDRIAENKYCQFTLKHFREAGRAIQKEAFSYIYNLFEGHTYYIHHILHNAFAYLPPEKLIVTEDLLLILSDILDERGHNFSGLMNLLNYQQKEVLIAIAKDKNASHVTSVAFVKKHSLKSPSSVQYAISTLLEKQLITYENLARTKIYSITDRFFAEWLRNTY